MVLLMLPSANMSAKHGIHKWSEMWRTNMDDNVHICDCHITLKRNEHCVQMHMCAVSNVVGINEKKQICLLNKEYLSDDICRRTNVSAKCKILLTLIKTSLAFLKTKTYAKQGINKWS